MVNIEISTVGDLRKALEKFTDETDLLAIENYTHVTKNGKEIPVGTLYEIKGIQVAENNSGIALILTQENLAEEALNDPENNLTEEDLEKEE